MDHPVLIGYEIEAISPWDAGDTLHGFTQALGVKRTDPYEDTNQYAGWQAKYDGSIKVYRDDYVPVELVSPIMPYEVGMELLPRAFQWMIDKKVYTNVSCGFHVGLSLPPNVMKRINHLKMAMLLDESSILSMFQRQDSRYCQSWKKTFPNYGLMSAQKITADNEYAALAIIHDRKKYHTVNFLKLQQGYLEFRPMGGENYERRIDDIVLCIDHFRECLIASCDPKIKQAEYESRLKLHLEGKL